MFSRNMERPLLGPGRPQAAILTFLQSFRSRLVPLISSLQNWGCSSQSALLLRGSQAVTYIPTPSSSPASAGHAPQPPSSRQQALCSTSPAGPPLKDSAQLHRRVQHPDAHCPARPHKVGEFPSRSPQGLTTIGGGHLAVPNLEWVLITSPVGTLPAP